MTRRRFAEHNAVRGRPGWHYGLIVLPRETDAPVRFDVFNADTGQRIDGLTASRYRTTRLARYMHDKRPGYEHVARTAIAELLMSNYLTPTDPRWAQFIERMEGPGACDFQERDPDGKEHITWKCDNSRERPFARRALAAMGYDQEQIERTLLYCEQHGGYCDCEIVFNVMPPGEDSERQ